MIELNKVIKLLPPEKKFIDFIMGNSFPWYFQGSTYNFTMHCHSFMDRNESSPESRGTINSEYAPIAESIMRRVCRDNGVDVKTVYRLAVNSTTAAAHARGDIHVDQGKTKHRVFLLYLNKFSDGSTYVWLDDDYEPTEIKAEENKAVVFDGEYHAQGFCKVGERRIVLVATFNAREAQ